MPFNTQGVYVVVSGATTAAPGQVITSAIWNSIHSDEATALTSLGAYAFQSNAKTLTTSTAYTVGTTDQVIFLNRGTAGLGPTTISLPTTTLRLANPLFFKDIVGNTSGSNVVVLKPAGAETIEGAASYTLNTNFAGTNIIALASGGWIITGPDFSDGLRATGTVSGATLTAINGVITSSTGTLTSSGAVLTTAGGLGYATGAGGTASQVAVKNATVTLNAITGEITTSSATLAAGTAITFSFVNSNIATTDLMILNHVSGGTLGGYTLNYHPTSAGVGNIDLRNVTAGALAEAIVIGFSLFKSVTS